MAQKVRENWLQKIKQQLKTATHLNGNVQQNQEQPDDDVDDTSVRDALKKVMAKQIYDRRSANLTLNYLMMT